MTAVLELRNVSVTYSRPRTFADRFRRRAASTLKAVDSVSLQLNPGDALGLVGESGCGKSSLARAIVGLSPTNGGEILLNGKPFGRRRSRQDLRQIQMVFQDPASALNPRMTVRTTLMELLALNLRIVPAEREARCRELLKSVGLSDHHLELLPSELSGGQKQRVSIARALALDPQVLIADESVAALDVSVQASILELLRTLRSELGLTLLFISHDLSAVRQVCDDIAVMYLGTIVELRKAADLLDDPVHPYSRALVSAAPNILARKRAGSSALTGEPPSPTDARQGCPFYSRCDLRTDRCQTHVPLLIGPTPADLAACFVTRPHE